jgi:hypothetical protein
LEQKAEAKRAAERRARYDESRAQAAKAEVLTARRQDSDLIRAATGTFTHDEIEKLLGQLTKRFPDAIREANAIRDIESRLHAKGQCSSVSKGLGCPLRASPYSSELSRGLQAGVLIRARPPIVWPNYSDPKIRSSMFRPPQPMSEEKKAELRALAPKRPSDVGDEVAKMLRECEDLKEVYACGAKYLEEKESVLREKYSKLNPGQQRMVIGNRMRAKWKKEHAS